MQPIFCFYLFAVCPAFLIASITDIKRHEIPLWDFPALFVLYIVFFHKELSYLNWSTLGIMAAAFFFLAVFGKIGGGDIIMFSVIGFIIGLYGIISYLIILFCISCVVFMTVPFIWKKKNGAEWKGPVKGHEFPIAPMAGASFGIWLVLRETVPEIMRMV